MKTENRNESWLTVSLSLLHKHGQQNREHRKMARFFFYRNVKTIIWCMSSAFLIFHVPAVVCELDAVRTPNDLVLFFSKTILSFWILNHI